MELNDYAKGAWICPVCGHKHSKPHYSLPGQIDYDKQPAQIGRIRFNRRRKDDSIDPYTPERYDMPSEGDQFDEEGYQRPLYCPHCGFEDDWIIIKRLSTVLGLVEQFLKQKNGQKLTEKELLYQFLGYLKGRGVAQ